MSLQVPPTFVKGANAPFSWTAYVGSRIRIESRPAATRRSPSARRVGPNRAALTDRVCAVLGDIALRCLQVPNGVRGVEREA